MWRLSAVAACQDNTQTTPACLAWLTGVVCVMTLRRRLSLSVLFQRVLFAEYLLVLGKLHEVHQEKDDGYGKSDNVEHAVIAAENVEFLLAPAAVHVNSVEQYHDEAELRGAEAAVSQAELALQYGADVGVDRQAQVARQHQHGNVELEDRRQSGADAHDADGDGVESVVDEEAVDGPLRLAHARQRAVKAVAVPVDDKPERRYPKVVDVIVAQEEAYCANHSSGHSDERQHVRRHPSRLPVGQPY